MRMKIRPFEEYFESAPQKPAVVMTGRVEEGAFVVTALGRAVRLAVEEVGADERGSYAILADEQTLQVVGDFRLEVLHEYDEDLGASGAELRLVCDREALLMATAAARAQGINTEKINLIVPPDAVYSVYFNGDGIRDGRAAYRRASEKGDDPPAVH